MWSKKKVAVIFPTYREKKSIRRVIKEFDSAGYIDEIIVVDNNSEKGTIDEVKKTRARILKEPKQGFAYAVRTGIKACKSDLIIIAEPDGTFDGRDVPKLLSYSDDFDTVFCSRTRLPLIRDGSDMTAFKRLGDIMLAKLANILFLSDPISDLGCTLRLTNRKGWKQVEKECHGKDTILDTEWVLIAAKNKVKFVEIPINFRARIGDSPVSGTLLKKLVWGYRKFFCIWKIWFYSILGLKLT